MALVVQSDVALPFNLQLIEQIVLDLADAFNIRVLWDRDTAVITGVLAVAGGFIGGYAGGRMGAALGASIVCVTGLGVSTMMSLREIWDAVKKSLKELLYIVFNFLHRLDPNDYVRAFQMLLAYGSSSRTELILTMVDFVAQKLNREVSSSLTAA